MSRHKPGRERTPRRSSHAIDARVKALTARGIEHAGQGNLAEAAAQFLEAVRLQPGVHYLHGNLGNILQMLGDLDSAAEHYRRALELEPGDIQTCSNLAVLLHKQGHGEEAIRHLRQALLVRPDYHDALNNLGNVLQDTGDLQGACDCYQRALQVDPCSAAALRGMGNVHLRRQEHAQAVDYYERALEREPGVIDVHRVLAAALVGAGRWHDGFEQLRPTLGEVPEFQRTRLLGAIDCFQEQRFEEAMTLLHEGLAPLVASPVSWPLEAVLEALGLFARFLLQCERAPERESVLRMVLALQPESAQAHLALGVVLQETLREDEAILQYAEALRLDPQCSSAWSNLSRAFMERGRLDDARACMVRALEIDPANSVAHSNLIFVGDLDARGSRQEATAERLRWREQHAAHLAGSGGPHANPPVAERRLRVGYVSGDFRHHSAASCVTGVICYHDPEQVEVACYSNYERAPDAWTERFRKASTLWRDVAGMSDQALSEMIRADGIDILVDLSGHSARNRLLTFARKPAPVQVTAWGHATGTGLDTIDYLFTDPICAPPHTQAFYAERLCYLPCALSYEPPGDSPPVASLPAARGGGVTFGCLNRVIKISRESLMAWAAVLRACPGTRFLLKDGGFSSPEVVARIRSEMRDLGVDPARLVFRGATVQSEHIATFHEVDLALDPFPSGGGITTLEGLWMGVPAVTLLGDRGPESRITSSMMTALGLGDFVATSLQEYVQVAASKAQDLERLSEIRRDLRSRLLASPLVGGVNYCRAVEAAYREMWREWCRTVGTSS